MATEKWLHDFNDTDVRKKYYNDLEKLWEDSDHPTMEKLCDFTKYVPKTSIIQFLARYELYKLIKDVPGSIVECGVCGGRGLFSFVHSVFINEPMYRWRHIIGFDTWEGFPSIDHKDLGDKSYDQYHVGGLKYPCYDELKKCAEIHEDFRFLKGRPQIELIKGDACKTIPEYTDTHPELAISLLYLDFDLYEPTKIALEHFLPRMPKGSIVALDEFNMYEFPGETLALFDVLKGFNKAKMVRLENIKTVYFVIE